MKKILLLAAAASFAAQSASAAGLPNLGKLGATSLSSAVPSLQTLPLPALGGFSLGDVPVIGGDEFGITVSQLAATGLSAPKLPSSLGATFLPIVTSGTGGNGEVGLVSQAAKSAPFGVALIKSAYVPKLSLPSASGLSLSSVKVTSYKIPSVSTLAPQLPGLALVQAALQR